ncbi:restriction endonuclease [Streptomyces mesophilus]|uniref:restriction endonuclease n=1 Tax=Streptomyces mesophilus TaxID=1775132 RepID=UPI003329FB9B
MSRRRRSRRQRQQDLLWVYGIAALFGVSLVVTLLQWLLAHWWLLLVLAVLGVGGGGFRLFQRVQRAKWDQVQARALRYGLAQLDALHHREFEFAIRDLMRRDGCPEAVRVGGANDNGADVKATDPYGRRWVIQCKHRRAGLAGSAVGTPDLQVLNGTARPVHKADVVVLVTNGRFSKKAPPFATSQRIHLVDRALLGTWAAGSRPLWELLRKVPLPADGRRCLERRLSRSASASSAVGAQWVAFVALEVVRRGARLGSGLGHRKQTAGTVNRGSTTAPRQPSMARER